MVFTLPEHVSCHDIAGIWVAFFSRCQRYRCGQVNLFRHAVKENLRQKVELLSNVPGYQICKEESIFALASLCRRVWVDPMQEVVSLRLPATASGESCC